MIERVVFFSKPDDLLDLTGIKKWDDLWDAGFDLDDIDFGICVEEPWDEEIECEGEVFREPVYHPYYRELMMMWMDSHCVGYRHTEYDGKHYYIAYHS